MIKIEKISNKELKGKNDKYKIKDYINAGGGGTVFLCNDSNSKEFAGKIFSRLWDKKRGIKRFKNEIKIHHTFDHPNLIKAIDSGEVKYNGDTLPFYVMPKADLGPCEEIFRAKVLKMLKDEGKIDDALISNLMSWKHSGFSVHNGVKIAKDDDAGKENVAQYIIRNTFSLKKLNYVEETGTVIYHSKMTPGKNKKNFVVFEAEDFIAAICQHIPGKIFQMVRYFGFIVIKVVG